MLILRLRLDLGKEIHLLTDEMRRSLPFMKAKLKNWRKETFRDIKEKKDTILKDIPMVDSCEGEGALTSELAALRHARKIELEQLSLRELG